MAFQGGSRVDPNEQIKDVDQQIVQGIREGKAFHQSPTLENGPYRSRVLDPVNPQHEGNLFSAYNASVLHTQVQERDLGSPEFVKSAVLKELGHERKDDTRFEKQYWVAPSGSRMAAVGGGTVKTTGAPHAYLHVETQTTLPTKDFPLKGKLDEKGLVTAVETVAKLSGVKLQYAKDDRLAHKDGKAGPTVVVPTPDKFQSREAWASAALTGVASAVQRSPRLRSEVEVDAVEMAAVRSENNRRGVSNFRRREAARDQGAEPGRGQARVGPQTDLPGYLRVRGDASAAVFTEALTKLAKERGVTLDLEGRNPQASFDGKTKTFTAAGRGEFRGPERNAAWKQQALSDLAKEVGGKGMAKAVDEVRRGDRYAVVKAVGVGNFRPEQTLGTAEEEGARGPGRGHRGEAAGGADRGALRPGRDGAGGPRPPGGGGGEGRLPVAVRAGGADEELPAGRERPAADAGASGVGLALGVEPDARHGADADGGAGAGAGPRAAEGSGAGSLTGGVHAAGGGGLSRPRRSTRGCSADEVCAVRGGVDVAGPDAGSAVDVGPRDPAPGGAEPRGDALGRGLGSTGWRGVTIGGLDGDVSGHTA